MKRILLTGASGFLGKRIYQYLRHSRLYDLSLTYRTHINEKNNNYFVHGEITSKTDFSEALLKQDVVIHTAARVHIMNEKSINP